MTGEKPGLAFPCRLPGKLGKTNFSRGDWYLLPAVGPIVQYRAASTKKDGVIYIMSVETSESLS